MFFSVQAATEDREDCPEIINCLAELCLNGGICVDDRDEEGVLCLCLHGFSGKFCELTHEESTLRLSMEAIMAILFCLLNMLVLLLVVLVCKCAQRYAKSWDALRKDVIRDNIISYHDEGGEVDTNTYDIRPLRIPVESSYGHSNEQPTSPLDDVRVYAYEGSGSTAGSLSSLSSSGTDSAGQAFGCLSGWGAKFQKLAYMYHQ
ncbi:neural-cadherin-like [Tropilaelaps mercedesae]|uniref:Neural-cadherin-like n=1 Tax=Tropilaelaps mercedesae TaxID=418985 RepID=A0A1V9XYL1_9ACAR|nr:neural-cadherin-like [Tropilaelaps mercedesae]